MVKGISQQVAAIIRDGRLDPVSKLVWLAHGTHDGGQGSWASHGRIARYLGVSEDTVKRRIKELERLGLIDVNRRIGGRGKTNTVKILVPAERGAGAHGFLGEKGCTAAGVSTQKGVQACRERGAGAHREVLTEKLTKDIRQVFEHWREVSGHSKCTLTEKRTQKIGARLKEGFSVEQLERVIEITCGPDSWHHENGHDFPETIFRNRERVERHLERTERDGGSDRHFGPLFG